MTISPEERNSECFVYIFFKKWNEIEELPGMRKIA